MSEMKIAIAYDFLNSKGGGEYLLLEAAKTLDAPIYTTYYHPEHALDDFKNMDITTSNMQNIISHIPTVRSVALPLYIEELNFSDFDVVLSIGTWMHGIVTNQDTLHVSYCLSPNRRIWDTYHKHRQNNKTTWFGLYGPLYSIVSNYMRTWDYNAAQRPDAYMTISGTTQQRIKKYYNRDSTIIYPPVDTKQFMFKESEGYYLTVSRLFPEKRIDEIIKAFKELGSAYPLKIVGTGPEYNRLRKLCSGCDHIELMGYVDNSGLIELYSRCEAFVFAGIDEDFGIAPVEAMASGKHVIAIHEGGLRETVIENETGVFFYDAKASNIKSAIETCERIEWDVKKIIEHARQYDVDVFRNRLTESVKDAWDNWNV